MRTRKVMPLLVSSIILASGWGGSNDSVASMSGDPCMQARQVVVILKMQRPVYLDEQGHYRVKWVNDPYKGQRNYVEDDAREDHLNRALDKLKQVCERPNDPAEMQRAEHNVVTEAKCIAAKADLDYYNNPETRTAKQKIRDQAALVKRYCDS